MARQRSALSGYARLDEGLVTMSVLKCHNTIVLYCVAVGVLFHIIICCLL